MCTDCAAPKLSPWRDFSQEEQRVMRDLLRKMKERRGKRYEVRILKNGELQISEVDRRVVLGSRDTS